MADRIVVMLNGAVEQVGIASRSLRSAANLFVASFLGSPAMNFLPGQMSVEGMFVSQDGSVIVSPQKLIRSTRGASDLWLPTGGGRS